MLLVVELLYCGQMPKQIELVFMATHSNGQAIIFLPCGFFYLLLIVFFSSPNLSGRRLDVYHTSMHGVAAVALVRI